MNSLNSHRPVPVLAGSLLLFLMLSLALVCPGSLRADDGALTETPAGGLQWSREPAVSMVKERLTISMQKVTVEFEFLNETDHDISARVGFPIPDYTFAYRQPVIFPFAPEGSNSSYFNDFTVWINDKQRKYQTEERAFLNGKDYTETLTKYGVNIGTFGEKNDNGMDPSDPDDQLTRLRKDQREELVKLGLIDEAVDPQWTVRKTHHWTQLFPAHEVVRIRHEYTPVIGSSGFGLSLESLKDYENMCLDDNVFNRLKTKPDGKTVECVVRWVKYILTGANTWKTPIKDFELIVDKSLADNVSFCWDGKVENQDANHVVVRVKDFVPTKDLTVYYLHLYPVDSEDGSRP